MSSLHSMRKEIAKNTLRFMPDMYNNVLGSVVICAYMFNGAKEEDQVRINKRWRELVRNPEQVGFWIDDPDFIDKSLALFDMTRPEGFSIAMVQSDFNVLFLPYFNDQIWPIREDGVFPMSARKGKIYPVNFTNTHDENTTISEVEKKCQEAENLVRTQAKQQKQPIPQKL